MTTQTNQPPGLTTLPVEIMMKIVENDLLLVGSSFDPPALLMALFKHQKAFEMVGHLLSNPDHNVLIADSLSRFKKLTKGRIELSS